MTLPFAEETYTVSQLGEELKGFLGQAFPSVWVAGEVQRLRLSQSGHVYFELVEKGARDAIVGRLEAAVWRSDWERVRRVLERHGQRLADGQQIRCRGLVDFYAPGGRLQLAVRDVDPVFTLGLLARRRQETLQALQAAGLLDRNRALALPELPLDVALVTSAGSAAYHDFLATLRESGYGFRVLFVHAAVQGGVAERQLLGALRAAAARGRGCLVLVRGGGARSDLQVFDSQAVAEALARCPLPVLTGLGHEIDEAIADRVAHTALKTPTKVAEFLVERVAAAERRLGELRRALRRGAASPLGRARTAVARAGRGGGAASARLQGAAARLDDLARATARQGRGGVGRAAARAAVLAVRLRAAAPRRLERRRHDPERLLQRAVDLMRGRLGSAAARIDGVARLCAGLDPQRTLGRGYSITRTAAGRLVRHPGHAPPGERLITQTAGGAVRSRVEEA